MAKPVTPSEVEVELSDTVMIPAGKERYDVVRVTVKAKPHRREVLEKGVSLPVARGRIQLDRVKRFEASFDE